MRIDRKSSVKINILRFPLIFGVVLIHMGDNYSQLITDSNDVSTVPYKYFMYLLSDVILLVAVPLFFIISSFLFFKNFQFNSDCYSKKLKSRVRTILVPYLFWNISYLIFKFVIQTVPQLASAMGGTSKRMVDYNLFDYFDALFGYTNFPISYQFWFLKDLIIMFILAPLIWLICRRLSWIWITLLFIIWCLDLNRVANIHNESWLFFSLGCLIAQKNYNLRALEKYRFIFLFLYTTLALSLTALLVSNTKVFLLEEFVILGGIVTFWYGSDTILKSETITKVLLYLSSYAFFIYAAHEPLLGILVKLTGKLFNTESYLTTFIMYYLYPLLIVILLWIVARGIKKSLPKFYATISGSR